jgi:hypothetical protein
VTVGVKTPAQAPLTAAQAGAAVAAGAVVAAGAAGPAVARGPGRASLRHRLQIRLRRTPGRLALVMVGLIALGLLAGGAGVLSVQDRSNLVNRVTATSGPLAVAAQDLYRSLSDADASAASEFLDTGPVVGTQPGALRSRYQVDIASASAALATVAAGVTQSTGVAAVGQISAQLPVYSGLVETARTYNRQRVPLGAAYLREASGLMRNTLLPAAEKLVQSVTSRLITAGNDAAGFPWIALPLGLLAVAGLVVAQVRLKRRTNRVFNVGLVGATAAALALVIWLGAAWAAAAGHLDASRRDGTDSVNALTQARIVALRARSDESLTLIARGNGKTFDDRYTAELAQLLSGSRGGLLGSARASATDATTRGAIDAAIADAKQWQTVHKQIRQLDDTGGDYGKTVSLAIGAGQDSAGGIFGRLDADLDKAISHSGDRFSREAGKAGDALSGVAIGLGVLTILLILGVAVGYQRRIAEYR